MPMQADLSLLAFRPYSTHREWLETDGLGGYAGGTISGSLTRRYHGLLCVPLSEFGERHVLVSKVMPTVILPDEQRFDLDCNVFDSNSGPVVSPSGDALLERFWIDDRPHWEFRCGKALLHISLLMPRGTAATVIEYCLTGTPSATLLLQPLLACRSIHRTAQQNSALNQTPSWNEIEATLTVKPYVGYPGFHIVAPPRTRWRSQPAWWQQFSFLRDFERGFDGTDDLHAPGIFSVELHEGQPCYLALCAPHVRIPSSPEELFKSEVTRRQSQFGGGATLPLLRRAAEQFLTFDHRGKPGVVAGYPWFDRWGRDTLIALPDLCTVGGDARFERAVIEHQLELVQDGLIPNLITESGTALYNSIDAVLWLFNAVYLHRERTHDNGWITRIALPILRMIVESLQRGTRFSIFVGSDGLLAAGSGDVQLTWMDAKVDGHPVTPRHGKAVEINALWFNALKILGTLETSPQAALCAHAAASLTQRSFVERFIKPDGSLRDLIGSGSVTEGEEVRPNQIFAISLPFPILDSARAAAILTRIREELLTPRGLRTLAPGYTCFHPRYEGGPRERDRAYHQGTVWPWLFAPYIRALAAQGWHEEIVRIQESFATMMGEGCIGSIAEVYDAVAPQRPGGCFAQAWSVSAAATAFLHKNAAT